MPAGVPPFAGGFRTTDPEIDHGGAARDLGSGPGDLPDGEKVEAGLVELAERLMAHDQREGKHGDDGPDATHPNLTTARRAVGEQRPSQPEIFAGPHDTWGREGTMTKDVRWLVAGDLDQRAHDSVRRSCVWKTVVAGEAAGAIC